jgi:hypothetical protein
MMRAVRTTIDLHITKIGEPVEDYELEEALDALKDILNLEITPVVTDQDDEIINV